MRFARQTSEFDRSLSFFDVAYGFALTLLIANIDVPPPDAWRNIHTLLAHGVGTQLAGFLISFIVITMFWRTNQDLLSRLRGMDRVLVTWNVYRAGLVIFIPFTTQGMSDPQTVDLPLPTVLYAVNVSVAILAQVVMYVIAGRRGLLETPVTPRAARAEIIDALSKPVVLLGSIPIAYLYGGIAAKLSWLSLFVIGPAVGIWATRVARREGMDL